MINCLNDRKSSSKFLTKFTDNILDADISNFKIFHLPNSLTKYFILFLLVLEILNTNVFLIYFFNAELQK